jgi:hypothetical protein
MADYLAGIVARTTGAAPTVRPRVPSLFEPVGLTVDENVQATAPAPSRPEESRKAAPPDRTVSEPPREDAPSTPRRARRPTTTEVEATVEEPKPALAQPERPRAERAPPRTRADAGDVSPPTKAPRPRRAGEPLRRARPEITPAPPPVHATEETTTVLPRRHDVQRRLQTIAEAVLTPERHEPTFRPRSSPEAPATEEASPLRPRVSGTLEADAVQQASRAPAPAAGEKLVQVNIGRVEVRAPASPGKPDAPRRRHEPPTRLEEYLGRRNGTRR